MAIVRLTHVALLGSLIGLLAACGPPRLYYPSAVPAPLFSGAGNTQIAVRQSSGTELQAAAALTPHVGLFVGGLGSFIPDRTHTALGGGLVLHGIRTREDQRLEFIVGGDVGRAEGIETGLLIDGPPSSARAHFSRVYTQVNLRNGESPLHAGVRVVRVAFDHIETGGTSDGTWTPAADGNGTQWLLEPSIIVRSRRGPIRLESQFGGSLSIGRGSVGRGDRDYGITGPFVSIGAIVSLNALFRRPPSSSD